jgi:hypothetical protein
MNSRAFPTARFDSILVTWLGIVAVAFASVIAGVVFAVLAFVGMGVPFFGAVAAIFGAAIGLITSPLLVWALWVPPRWTGLPIIMLPTAAVSLGIGVVVGSEGNPMACVLVSCTTYVSLSLAFGHWARKRRRVGQAGLPRCPACGYSLRGLPLESKCPECGRPY